MRKSVLLPLILLVAMVASGVGYGVLDAYNLVPGILTLENESVDMPETVEISLTDAGNKEVIGINEHAAKITAAVILGRECFRGSKSACELASPRQ